MYKKVILSKVGHEPTTVHYEVGKEIESKEYEGLLNKFTPNFEFSLTDKMIQDFSPDIVPSFKKSSLFTNEDLDVIVGPFKKDYIFKRRPKKKSAGYFNPPTRKRGPGPKRKNKPTGKRPPPPSAQKNKSRKSKGDAAGKKGNNKK